MGCEPKSKWFPPPKMSWAFTFVYSSMGFISIFPGILCNKLLLLPLQDIKVSKNVPFSASYATYFTFKIADYL